jgi:hypothetical protein
MATERRGHATPVPRGPARIRPQHVWVCVTGVWGDTKDPGLLLEWRQRTDQGWEGLVIWVATYSGGWDLRQGWMCAEHVRQRD